MGLIRHIVYGCAACLMLLSTMHFCPAVLQCWSAHVEQCTPFQQSQKLCPTLPPTTQELVWLLMQGMAVV
jgi:hypothetical protein